MTIHKFLVGVCLFFAFNVLVRSAINAHSELSPVSPEITWKKTVLDSQFRSEGVAVADVNHDGKPDILAGNLWYEAPTWTPHEIAPVKPFDGEHGYSECFLSWAADINRDGWPDQVVVGFPGAPAVWRENPRNQPGHWKEHVITTSACNESPAFADLLGNGKPVLISPFNETQMAWYEPGPDPTKPWIQHLVGEPKQPGVARFAHGLGVGDVNGDGRADIICKDGYYEAPEDRRNGIWRFVPAKLGPDCAQMAVFDVNHDGRPDVITSSAHNIGVWWWEQAPPASTVEFVQHVIDDSFSQSHSLVLADINGDRLPDIVTGKRFWAHGPTGDVRPGDPAVIYWFEMKRNQGTVEWIRHEVDHDSGVGTQFTVTDVNKDGLPDIVTSNKKGVHLFIQQRKRK